MSNSVNTDDLQNNSSNSLVTLSRTSSGGIGPDSSGSSNGGCTRRGRASPITSLVSRVSLTKLSEERRARRCRFYRNGDQWFPGAVIAVGGDKHRTWEALLEDLTRLLDHPQHLASGVRHIFSLGGSRITNLDNLSEGSEYVASSTELFKNIDYQKAKLPQWRIHAKRKEALHVTQPKTSTILSPNVSSSFASYTPYIGSLSPCDEPCKDYIKPKLTTVIRNGVRPRRAVRILLNRRTARSFDQVLNDITDAIKLDSGAVRKVFSISGKPIMKLKDFFEDENLFVAYGAERHYFDDFELDPDECKNIQPLIKGSVSPRRHRRMASPQPRGRPVSPLALFDGSGSLPRSPRKSRFHSPNKRMTASLGSNHNGHLPSDIPQEIYPFEVQSRYSIGHVLGDGNFAIVKHCLNRKSKEEYALKIIDKAKCRGKEHMIESEVSILRRISHPNIVSLIEEFESRDSLYLVMELVRGGDLFDAIASATKYTESEASSMLRDLCSALHYLHQRNIVHRDIKPENLLVETGADGATRLKLGDFGLAVEVTEPLHTVCGTPTYVAPEILAETGYGLKVDIWAAGVITYILLCGFPPFVSATNNQEELFDQILRGYYEFHSPYWDPVSLTAKELIVSMIQVDQEKRFSAAQVLSHSWTTMMNPLESNGSSDHDNVYLTSPQGNNNFDSL